MPVRSLDFGLPIPLFPLPDCVLLPHATIPLHIFEPRYRRMITDALHGRKLMALAVFEGEHWKYDYLGHPPVRPCVCVGHIAKYERFPDGRYNLLVQGICRARILRELPPEAYRQAILQPTEIPGPGAGEAHGVTPWASGTHNSGAVPGGTMEIDLAPQRQALEALFNDPLLNQLTAVSAIHNWLCPEIPTAALVDLGTMAVCEQREERYRMLSEADPVRRALWLRRHLQSLRSTLYLASRFEAARDEDGVCLNLLVAAQECVATGRKPHVFGMSVAGVLFGDFGICAYRAGAVRHTARGHSPAAKQAPPLPYG